MKKLILLYVFLAFIIGSGAQGIEFNHGTFAETLAKAKQENKMVFIDCYTVWCGPCKMLSSKVFPQEMVGDYFNKNFVSIKMDMEKGEGIELRKKYGVQAFPTLLFLNPEGKVLHTKVGGCSAEQLIEEAKITFDPSKQISTLTKRYNEGGRSMEFIAQYVTSLNKSGKKDELARIGKEFLENASEESLLSEDAFTILMNTNALAYGDEKYNFILKNKQKFLEEFKVDEQQFSRMIEGCISSYLRSVAQTKSMEELKAAIATTKKDHVSPHQEMMESYLIQTNYIANKKFDEWYKLRNEQAQKLMDTNKSRGYGMIIQTAYEISYKPEFEHAGLYEKAIVNVKNVLKERPDEHPAYFCLANLYWRTNNKEEALKNINSFIDFTKSKGREVSKRALDLKKKIEEM